MRETIAQRFASPARPDGEGRTPVRAEGGAAAGAGLVRAQVVRLDRGYPLVRSEDGRSIRCEHATDLVKTADVRAVVGDFVEVEWPEESDGIEGHDKGIIARILPRSTKLVRKDPAERALPQVLAANFDLVIVAQPLAEVNLRRLERELVLAFETGARVAVVLTKADLADDAARAEEMRARVEALVGADVPVIVMSAVGGEGGEPEGVGAVRALIGDGETAVLIGKSGVGKSSLVNLLAGADVQETGSVRAFDGKGRHTTVSREIVDLPGGGRVVDMPGVRGLGMWESDAGIGVAFADVESFAAECRFRDCRHQDEPGCAVRAAVKAGELASERLASYLELKRETDDARIRRIEADRRAGEGKPGSRAGVARRAQRAAGGAKKGKRRRSR